SRIFFFFFFFQAEDGIRDRTVTGVQTCALPISSHTSTTRPAHHPTPSGAAPHRGCSPQDLPTPSSGSTLAQSPPRASPRRLIQRSEERRVGKECRAGRAADALKKN